MKTYIYKIAPTRAEFATSWTPVEEKGMAEHFAYLKNLLENGNLFLAGPCTDAAFGIVIIYADSLDHAREIASADPAITSGIMSYDVHEFRISLLKK